MVGVEIVHTDVWHVWRLHPMGCQGVPVEVVEPGVLLELLGAFDVADPVHWLPLQALVDVFLSAYDCSVSNFRLVIRWL